MSRAGPHGPRGAARRHLMAALLGLPLAAAVRAAAASPGDTVEVGIRDSRFQPETLTVRAGTTVRWHNQERRTSHSVLFPAEGLESERLLPGEHWTRRFDRPGRYPYTCGPHPEMKGLVVVAE